MVLKTFVQDLSEATGGDVSVQLLEKNDPKYTTYHAGFVGTSLDHQDIEIDSFDLSPEFLTTDPHEIVEETLHSDLLHAICPVTKKPDWGSIQVSYSGPQISHAGLLKYLCSFRKHPEFHELCVERVFTDIKKHCQPERLEVKASVTRRGGLDINPIRTTHPTKPTWVRLFRA